jgi:tetratricopeptide (TPR) repeat protein
MPSGRFILALVAAMLLAAATTPAAAADPAAAASPEAKLAASKHFRAGVAAYKNHAYLEAAESFEKAFSFVPHPTALWNAADARDKGGEVSRAANMYVRYLAISSDDDKDRVEARARIAALTGRLGRLDITGSDATDIRVNEEYIEHLPYFVDPGDHVVVAMVYGEKVTRRVNVQAGTKVRVVLEAGAGSEGSEEKPRPERAAAAKADTQSGLGPEWAYIGAGATAVLLGVTVWSGVDTQSRRRDFDANPTHQGYVDGVAAQKRTNILLGVTALAGVATVGLSVFAVKWDGDKQATVGISPRGATLAIGF